MVYLLATLGNDAEHVPSLLHAVSQELEVPALTEAPETWGIGYYADDQALLIQRPAALLDKRSFFELAREVKSRILLACIRTGPDQEWAPPFRFRRWLFGVHGDISGLQTLAPTVTDRLPDFIRSELEDRGPAALAFGMFLRELFHAQLLDDPLADPEAQARALKRTTDTIGRLCAEKGSGPVRASYVATRGRSVLVTQAGAPLVYKVQEGLEALPEGPLDPARTDFNRVAEALKRFRAVVVAKRPGLVRPGWRPIEEDTTLAIDSGLEIKVVH